jgi:hypothetical protein
VSTRREELAEWLRVGENYTRMAMSTSGMAHPVEKVGFAMTAIAVLLLHHEKREELDREQA